MAENGILDYQGMNQAIYRGATSNIVVDTQSMSIEIGAGNTSHTSNLHFECNHDANVASIKLNSNVVTEFPRSRKLIKYPRVALTGSTSGGYTASANAEESAGRAVWKVFDNTGNAIAWRSEANGDYNASGAYTGSANLGSDSGGTAFADADKGDWVKIQLPHKIKLDHFTLQVRNSPTFPGGSSISYGRSEFIKNGKVWGSNDGTSWSVVHTISGTSASSDTAVNTYTVTSSIYYRYFGLVITDTNATVTGLGTSLSEIELYGVPEYDPDAYGTDVTLKSETNVPNTDWLEVYYDAKGETTMPDPVPDLAGGDQNATVSGVTLNNEAFVFNGSSYLETSVPQITTGQWPYTMSFWFKVNEHIGSTWNYLAHLGNRQGTAGDSTLVGLQNDQISFTTWGDSKINSGIVATPGIWYHVTSTWPGGAFYDNAKLYINAVSYSDIDNTRDETSPLSFPTSGNKLTLGKQMNTTSDYFNGSIANFRLFNRALSQDEIYQLYTYQKEYFGHSTNNLTLKAGRLGIGTSEPRAALDINSGGVRLNQELWVTPAKRNDTVRVSTNTLSFYEEGSWTPTLGAVTAPTYTEQFGYYTRIGNIVHLVFRISVTGLDNGDGSGIHISLPYELANNNGHSAMCSFGYNNSLFDPNRSNGGANIGNNYIIPAQGGSGQTAVAVRYNNCYTSGTLLGFATYSLQVTK